MSDAPTVSPPVHRILAGPGSGKTRLLIQELRRRLDGGWPPESLLGVTFTRRAAQELRARLRAGTDTPAAPQAPPRRPALPWVGTFHQLAWRIQADTRRLRQPVNLDTLIPEATATLREGATPSWIRPLRFIAVDEAQDLDAAQFGFLLELRRHTAGCELLVVGDPDQAIFGFRSASPRFLLSLPEYLAPCRTVTLHENHRSARQIVEAARAVMSPAADPCAPCHQLTATRPEAHPAIRELVAESPEEEAQAIFSEVRTLAAVGLPLTRQAILVRTRAQFGPLRQEAQRWGIPVYTPPAEERVELRLDPPTPDPERALTLLTIHQAKGCEWTVVYLAGCQAGLIPHSAARTPEEYQEERRLLYVAVTRAQQLLWLARWGEPSPFLAQASLPGHASGWGDARDPADARGPSRSLWERVAGWLRS